MLSVREQRVKKCLPAWLQAAFEFSGRKGGGRQSEHLVRDLVGFPVDNRVPDSGFGEGRQARGQSHRGEPGNKRKSTPRTRPRYRLQPIPRIPPNTTRAW